MAQATEKSNPLVWLEGMPGSLHRLPLDQVKRWLLARLRELEDEIAEIERAAPSEGWWLQRVGKPVFDLNAPEWDPLLYADYLKAMRQAIVAAIQML